MLVDTRRGLFWTKKVVSARIYLYPLSHGIIYLTSLNEKNALELSRRQSSLYAIILLKKKK